MFKDLLSGADLTGYATWGLVIFVAVFVGVSVWILTRSRTTVNRWASIPLDDGPDPVDAREPRGVDPDRSRDPSEEKPHG